MKQIWLLFMAVFSLFGICRADGAVKIHKVAPAYWWAEMKILNYRFYYMVIILLLVM